MLNTAGNLLATFGCSAVYFASDEFSLIFPAYQETATAPYGGRVNKIVSIMPSYCSARFNYHLAAQVDPETTPPAVKLFLKTN